MQDLFRCQYFIEYHSTCYNYVVHLSKFEYEWLLLSHEHLNAIENYLSEGKSNKTEPSIMPIEAVMFVENFKNTLIVRFCCGKLILKPISN